MSVKRNLKFIKYQSMFSSFFYTSGFFKPLYPIKINQIEQLIHKVHKYTNKTL